MLDPDARLIGNGFTFADDHSFRIDAFAVLTGRVRIGRRVHVSTGARLLGSGGEIALGDGAFVSMGATILTATDVFAAGMAVGPQFPDDARLVHSGDVVIGPMGGVGAHSLVMPGVSIGWGSRLGAMSLLTRSIPPGEIWAGNPARRVASVDLDELRRLYGRFFE